MQSTLKLMKVSVINSFLTNFKNHAPVSLPLKLKKVMVELKNTISKLKMELYQNTINFFLNNQWKFNQHVSLLISFGKTDRYPHHGDSKGRFLFGLESSL
jgi:hypothetical protein